MERDSEQPQVAVEVLDVEEGEISDSVSIEEITEEAFNSKQEPQPSSANTNVNPITSASNNTNVNNNNNKSQNSVGGTATRVWTMRDLYKYQITSRNYPGLYNLAWAQAVNNKPLDEVLVMMEDNSNNNSNSDNNNNSSNSNSKRMESDCVESAGIESKVVIDVEDEGEKEEGELEEGEIDLESENMGIENENEAKPGSKENVELEKKQFDLIKKELESLTAVGAEESFDGLCLRLQSLMESVPELGSESFIAEKEALVQLLFGAIQIVYSVFCSMNRSQKEQNRDILSRFLAYVMSLKVHLFSFEQLKMVEVIRSSMDCSAVSSNLKDNNMDIDKSVDEAPINTDSDVLSDNANNVSTSMKKSEIESMSTGSSVLNECMVSLESAKSLVGNAKHKGLVFPLLDLHKDHDADSLPSPTRETSPPLPFDKGFVLGHGLVKPEWPVPRRTLECGSVIMHPNETDAVKAFSTYQQKFGRSSIFMSDKLPSPTPSEEGDSGDVDNGGEVSSASIPRNNVPVNTSVVGQLSVSSVVDMDILSGQGHSSTRTTSPMTPWPNPVLKSSSAKSRDPRLRLVNSDAGARDLSKSLLPMERTEPKVEPLGMMSSRKQKTVNEPVLFGPALKRQRNDLHTVTETGGWLEDRGSVGMQVKNGNSGIDLRKSEDTVTCISSSSITTTEKGNGNEKFQCVGPCATLPATSPITSLPIVSQPTNLPATGASTSLPATGPSTSLSATGPFASLPVTGPFASLPVTVPSLPVTDPTNTASFHSLLKDIAGNPSIWMNILRMEQLKSVDSIKSMTSLPTSNSILGAVPSIKVPPSKPPLAGHLSAGLLKSPLQAVSMEESGKVRMKPRDPRRVLHNGTSQKGGTVGPDQPKTNPAISQGMTSILGAQRQEDQLDRKPGSSSSIAAPDITRQFTKNLKNIADILSASQASISPPIVPQASSSQPAQVNQGKMKTKGVVSESSNLRSGIGLASQEVTAALSRPQNAWRDVDHLFEGFDDQQKAAIQRERTRRIEEQKKMFGARKLCLVLDLDHTLLNSAKFVEVDPPHDEILRKKEEQDREKPHRHLFRFPHMGMWTKLRPGIWNFLEKASKLYELHLYTMGNKYYATEMAKLLDPKGELFAGRVISRGDDGDSFDSEDRVPKSKDLEGVLGMESAVVIIDDSVRVWPHNKLNLIAVERYIYFPCSRRQFGLPGPSLLEIDHDERPEDGTLASSLAVIERIHEAFFAHQSLDEADVRNILASEQHKILAGCRIVFSRVFPVGETNPHMHPLWQTAEQFGAVCTNQIDEQVTHVVANSLGTDKVNWALSTGRFVVHPGWGSLPGRMPGGLAALDVGRKTDLIMPIHCCHVAFYQTVGQTPCTCSMI